MEVLLLLACGAMNVACFIIGAKVGQTVRKGETIELPSFEPLKTKEERAGKKEADLEAERLNAILRNVENYDGTGFGQEDVPRG